MKRTLVVILHAALSFGCDPEDIEHDGDSGDDAEQTFPSRFAEAYCAALFACDPVTTCTDSETPYASEAECIDGERTALEQASAVARDAGMTYDDACVDSWIAQYEEVGCDGSTRIIQRLLDFTFQSRSHSA